MQNDWRGEDNRMLRARPQIWPVVLWPMGAMMIDWTRVDELRAEVGDDGFDEVVDLFLEETDEVIARLLEVDDSALGSDMHFLKGSALNLGLSELAKLCQDGERLCGGGQAAMVDRGVLIHAYHSAKASFRDEIARRAA